MAGHWIGRTPSRRRVAVVAAFVVLAGGLAACGGDKTDTTGGVRAEPAAGSWQPWVINSPADFVVSPPPTVNTIQSDTELATVKKAAAGRTKAVRDDVAKWSQPLPTKPWMDLALDLVSKGPKDPPLASRNYALLSVAMYDATIATYYWKYQYNKAAPDVKTLVPAGPDPSYPSEHAAIAGAASRLLAYLYPNQAAQRLDEMADQAGQSRVEAGTNWPSDVAAGLDLGRQVADQVIAYAKTDRSDTKWDGKRPPGVADNAQYWQPSPGTVSQPVEPMAGTWKTWVMTSGSQFRPGPPPAFGSPEFVQAAKDMLDARNHLTPEQQQAIKFYAGVEGTSLPAGIVADVSQGDIIKGINGDLGGKRLSVPRAARAMALVTVAMADAGVAAWDTKFTYWSPRPDTVIPALGLDPNFKPVIDTPRFPAYMSGSSTYAGSAQQVMTYLFPDNAQQFKDRAETQAKSRVWAGIHWPYDEVGLDVGHKIGDLVVARAKQDGADASL